MNARHQIFFWTLLIVSSLFAREVPVRYVMVNDSIEQDAKFVKIAKDTVYLLPLDSATQAEIAQTDEALLNKIAPDTTEEETAEVEEPAVEEPVEEAVADSAVQDSAQAQPADDLEAAILAQERQAVEDSVAKAQAVEDSIRAAALQDSLAREAAIPIEAKYIRIFKFELKRMTNLEDGKPVDLSLSDFVFADEIEEEPLYPAGGANLLVTSYPDSCELYINGQPLEMTSPDTIKNIKPGKYTISVKKKLKDVDWWGTQTVKINGDSLNKVKIAVERPKTKLTLATIPDGVEVYLDRQPNESIMPEYITDVSIETNPSVQKVVYLRKVGYLDTALTVEVRAFMPNPVYVELEALDNASVVEMQREYDRERSRRRLGRGLLWSSIAPIVAGGVFWYLAERDWSDAADKKAAYKKSAFETPDTQRLVKKNKDLNDSGDTKGVIAIGLGVVGVGLFATGFVLAF